MHNILIFNNNHNQL